jgi:hypothetical protein
MKTVKNYVCPRCDYPLIPVHAREGSRRQVIALTCPEPYCDHMQLVPRRNAQRVEEELGEADAGPLRRTAT